jgi:preprotein translocase subunit SecD
MARFLVLSAFLVALGCAGGPDGVRGEAFRVEVPPTSAGSAFDAEAFQRLVHWRLGVANLEAVVERGEGCVFVRLGTDDPAERGAAEALLASLGRCEFFLVAEEGDVAGLEAERARFEAWRQANPDRPWLEYNSDGARGPTRVAWFPTRFGDQKGQSEVGPPMPVLLPGSAAGAFGSGDFERVYATQDQYGYPAIGFELTDARSPDFAAFTERIVNRRLAIVLAGEVRSAPSINSRLTGGGMIEGRFKDEDVRELLAVLEK